ncbi:MAG: class I tRNA ligase family protein, partial [Methyloligellaceae bacterium]
NLAQRSLSMIAKNCDGVLPAPAAFSDADNKILRGADAVVGKIRDAMESQAIHRALEEIWAVVADANRYFASQEPWALKKTDAERMGTVLYVTAEAIRQVAILAQPVMPDASGRILDQLGIARGSRDFSHLGDAGRIAPETSLATPEPVFPRYVEPEEAPG